MTPTEGWHGLQPPPPPVQPPPPDRFYLVVCGQGRPEVYPYTDEEAFLSAVVAKTLQLRGSGSYLFGFRGWQVQMTSVQVSMGIQLHEEGKMRSLVLQPPQMNTDGLAPQVIMDQNQTASKMMQDADQGLFDGPVDAPPRLPDGP